MDELYKRVIQSLWERGRWPWLLLFPGIPAWFWFTQKLLSTSFAQTLRSPLFLAGSAVLAVAAPALYFLVTRSKAVPLPPDALAIAIAQFEPASRAAKEEAANVASRIEEALEGKKNQGAPLVIRRVQSRIAGADEKQRREAAVKLATSREVNAHAVIWGEVRKDGPELYVKPRLTVARPLRGAIIEERTLPALKTAEPNQLDFKERLSRDIADIVTLVHGLAHRTAGALDTAIRILDSVRSPEGHFFKALSLCERAKRSERPQLDLRTAATHYRAALGMLTAAKSRRDWAMTQNNLGTALGDLGTRAGGEEGNRLLREAVAAYRAALEVRTQAELPQDWAMTQNNLGNALRDLGTRAGGEEGNELLREAIAAYRAALEVRTRAQLPQDWAMTQNNLGIALGDLADRAESPERAQLVEDALACFDNALSVYDAANFPERHARIAALKSRTAALLESGHSGDSQKH